VLASSRAYWIADLTKKTGQSELPSSGWHRAIHRCSTKQTAPTPRRHGVFSRTHRRYTLPLNESSPEHCGGTWRCGSLRREPRSARIRSMWRLQTTTSTQPRPGAVQDLRRPSFSGSSRRSKLSCRARCSRRRGSHSGETESPATDCGPVRGRDTRRDWLRMRAGNVDPHDRSAKRGTRRRLDDDQVDAILAGLEAGFADDPALPEGVAPSSVGPRPRCRPLLGVRPRWVPPRRALSSLVSPKCLHQSGRGDVGPPSPRAEAVVGTGCRRLR
jgi:hypothetical protein